MSKFTFRCEDADIDYYLEMRINEINLPEIIASFEEFLKGCGFQIKDLWVTHKHEDSLDDLTFDLDDDDNGTTDIN